MNINNPHGVFSYLDCSTAHLSNKTMKLLEARIDGVAMTIAPYREGVFVSVPPPGDANDSIPDDLQRVLNYAREHACFVVRFDADAEPHGELPTYEWDQADKMVPCAMCKWPQATQEAPFCTECLCHVKTMTRQDAIQAQLATLGVRMEHSLSALDGEGHAITDIATGEMVESPDTAVIALAEEWSVLEGAETDAPISKAAGQALTESH